MTITKILILSTVGIWIAYDIFAYYHFGNSATESYTLYKWAYNAPGFAFLVGVLCGHLFFPQTEVNK